MLWKPLMEIYTVVKAPDTSYAKAVFAEVLNSGTALEITEPPSVGNGMVHNTAPAVPSLKSTKPFVALEL